MSQYNVLDFVNEANKQIQFYEQQQDRMKELLNDYKEKVNQLTKRSQEVLRQITANLVPEFTEAHIKHVAMLINNSALTNLISDKEKTRHQLADRIRTIESTPEFIQKDLYLSETTTALDLQREEMQPAYDAAVATVRLFQSVPRSEGLLQRGYGTSSYPHKGFWRFLNTEYLQDWKFADILCDFFKVKDFTDVLYKYREAQNVISVMKDSLKALEMQKGKISTLINEYASAKQKLENIDEEYYLHLRTSIELYFTSNSKATITRTFANKPEILELYAQFDGLSHQIEYVKELYKKVSEDINSISEKEHNLRTEAERYRADSYRYRNKRWDSQQFAKKFNRDDTHYRKRLDKYRRTGETIYVFNDYGRTSFLENFLWWDVITDGRLDGNFIPEVHDYYMSNPSYSYDREPDYSQDSSSDYSDES